MALRTQRELDSHDWGILRELQADARLSFNELARRVGLSSPAVVERVRRMEDAGVIAGYHARVDPAKIGLPVMALIHLRCAPGKCLLRTDRPEEYPEILEVLKLGGDSCTVLRVAVASIDHLEAFNARLGEHGELRTAMVWGAAFTRRVLNWEGGVPEVAPAPELGIGLSSKLAGEVGPSYGFCCRSRTQRRAGDSGLALRSRAIPVISARTASSKRSHMPSLGCAATKTMSIGDLFPLVLELGRVVHVPELCRFLDTLERVDAG